MSSKPTVVIVPGVCHTPQHFASLTGCLHRAGFSVVCKQLPSVDPPQHERPGMSDDISFIQQQLLQPLVDKGKDVLLVCHSYAGYPGGAAALGFSKKERNVKDQAGGIVGLLFIAALLVHEGASPEGMIPDGSWPCEYHCNTDEERGVVTFATPISTFYSPDVPECVATEAAAALRPMSIKALLDISAALVTKWADSVYTGCMAYVHCTRDATVIPEMQDLMVRMSGGKWTIVTMNTGHSPFLSRPAEMAETIVSLAKAFST